MSPFNHLTMRPSKKKTGLKNPFRPRTMLYYNAAIDTDWGNLGNWWLNSAFTVPATTLPNDDNSVWLAASVTINSSSPPTIYNLIVSDPNNDGWSLGVPVTVEGMAAFTGSSTLDSSIVGQAAFADASSNLGTVIGNAAFDNDSTNSSTVDGNATVNYPVARPLGGTVTGSITYMGYPFFLTTEDGLRLTSETGDLLVTEQFE